MDTRHSAVIVDGTRLHWAECGTDSHEVPLVLLHGLNDSHLTWQRIAPLLATNRRVLMLDAPGCGLSERPDASYQLEWHAHMTSLWLEKLGVSHVDLVGHSYGGGVAQVLLLEPKLAVRRLGLIASGGLGRRVALWLRLAALPGLVEHFGQPFMAAGTRLTLGAAGGCIPARDIDKLSAMNAAPGSARAFARTVRDVIGWRGQTKNFLHRAHEIAKLPPITLFWGENDVITPIEDALSFARAVDGIGFERFAGCGHYLHHEQPAALAGRLHTFLNAQTARPVRLQRVEAAAARAPTLTRGRLLGRALGPSGPVWRHGRALPAVEPVTDSWPTPWVRQPVPSPCAQLTGRTV